MHLVVYLDGVHLKCAPGEKYKLAEWNADEPQFCRCFILVDEQHAYVFVGNLIFLPVTLREWKLVVSVWWLYASAWGRDIRFTVPGHMPDELPAILLSGATL